MLRSDLLLCFTLAIGTGTVTGLLAIIACIAAESLWYYVISIYALMYVAFAIALILLYLFDAPIMRFFDKIDADYTPMDRYGASKEE